MHAIFGANVLEPRFQDEEAYYAGAEAAPSLYSILYSLEQAHAHACQGRYGAAIPLDAVGMSCRLGPFLWMRQFCHAGYICWLIVRHVARVSKFEIIDYTLCSRVYRPKDSVIPVPLRDADAFEAAVHKKLDEVVRVYSSESAAGKAKSASCQQIVDDVEFVRSKFVANILAATARKVPKRQREWDSAVESNRRVALPLLTEPKTLSVATGFCCPITQHLMQDPVLCTLDQYTYERSAIETALTNTGKSPMNNNVMLQPKQPVASVLIPNQSLRDAISFWVPRMLAQEKKTSSEDKNPQEVAADVHKEVAADVHKGRGVASSNKRPGGRKGAGSTKG